ncbi:FecR family protein [Algoriphagus halophytocola]|uniref:DUF4974 domain-containing protein n=1 Tax=Algoriphagus halophytocola TaxID=2991499 RepID=A0ABY6MFC7_9BACT|nr:FecR family protein [Algoriphagus sp. TR-M5]UZD21142.1 DUF4974 domain-containing protein [Algoriphagus sp. TR-M5]
MKSINHLFEISKVLVKRKLKGEEKLEPSEKEMLLSWRQKSAFYDDVVSKIDQEQIDGISAHFKTGLDKEKAWKKIEKSIQAKKQETWLGTIKWAAVFLVPLALGLLLFNQIYRGNEDTSISPGESGALLTLSDGSQYILEEVDGEIIVGQSGEKLKLDKGELIYGEEESSDRKVIYNTIETRVGNEYKLRLSDGTKVFLNAQSKLIYPVAFSGDTRSVQLEGEGYFEVSPDAEKPFFVEVKGMKVRVLGTSFNVKSYDNELVTETVLVEGKVKLVRDSLEEALLSPNEIAVFDKQTNKITVNEIDAVSATAWINGKYYFNNARLDDIMKDLARWYDFDASYSREELKDIRFEGWINRYEELDPILRIIEITNKIKIERDGKKLIIS